MTPNGGASFFLPSSALAAVVWVGRIAGKESDVWNKLVGACVFRLWIRGPTEISRLYEPFGRFWRSGRLSDQMENRQRQSGGDQEERDGDQCSAQSSVDSVP